MASRLSWEMKSITRRNEISDLFDRFGRQVRLAGSAGRLSQQVRPAGSAGLLCWPLCWAAMLGHYAGPLCCAAMLYGEIKIIARKMGVITVRLGRGLTPRSGNSKSEHATF